MTLLTRQRTLSRPQFGTLLIEQWRGPGSRMRAMRFTDLSGQTFEVPPDQWEFAVSPEATAAELAARSQPVAGRHRR